LSQLFLGHLTLSQPKYLQYVEQETTLRWLPRTEPSSPSSSPRRCVNEALQSPPFSDAGWWLPPNLLSSFLKIYSPCETYHSALPSPGSGHTCVCPRDLLEQRCNVASLLFSCSSLCRLNRYLCNKLQASRPPCRKKTIKPISETKLPIIYMPLLTLKRKTADDNIVSDRSGICC